MQEFEQIENQPIHDNNDKKRILMERMGMAKDINELFNQAVNQFRTESLYEKYKFKGTHLCGALFISLREQLF